MDGKGEPTGSTELLWLLRGATRRYRRAVHQALEASGSGDLAQAGYWLLDAMSGTARTATELVGLLQISKQAVSQLLDALAVQGYVERRPDPADRRRTLLHLTRRGDEAVAVMRDAVTAVDTAVADRIGQDTIEELRGALRRFVGSSSPQGGT